MADMTESEAVSTLITSGDGEALERDTVLVGHIGYVWTRTPQPVIERERETRQKLRQNIEPWMMRGDLRQSDDTQRRVVTSE